MTITDIVNSIYRRTKTNATSFVAADMLLAINSGQNRANSLIRKYIDNYRPTAITSSDVTTGTLVPVLDAEFHEIIPLWASYEYATENGLPNAQALFQEYQLLESELKRFYGSRNYNVFTTTIATPGVMTKDNHNLTQNTRISLMTTGALPTGLVADTYYYVLPLTLHTFSLALTRDGVAINTSGSQSGTHYYFSDEITRLIASKDSNK